MDYTPDVQVGYRQRQSYRSIAKQMGQKCCRRMSIRGRQGCCHALRQMEDGKTAPEKTCRRLRQEEQEVILCAVHQEHDQIKLFVLTNSIDYPTVLPTN